ncbi:hypothetical protein HO133_008416 [Letharia lupina]|uniref:Uncharacterized protein n=1 Tax=Letharia lupina TaxID=560253 RepID=A0A8H6CP47_9LECA|nr:uncharacterized protein HO133_008416 [Letharia lupina]KAF6226975.1 hypothetical protein HO133_008416 [Letharia lupina]
MGWLWGKSDPPKSSDSDPLRDLDPSLRDFLSKESPVKYTPAPPPPAPPPETTTPASATKTEPSSTPVVPPESLYPDGRYAHLWTTYKSLSAIEAESKSDQEKLLDILEGYKERKAQIGRAAVENCVEEQLAVNDCYDTGRWRDKLMMCRGENRAFERCYIMQSRFLKALGYLSTYSRPESVDEAIQMHADTLYHRMLAQEAAAAEAKAAGLPEPQFAPILASVSRSTTPAAGPTTPAPSPAPAAAAKKDDLPPLMPETQALLTAETQAALRQRLKGMTPTERELEEKGLVMDAKAARETGRQVSDIIGLRKSRREEGKATVGDTISGWFGW